MVPLHVHSNYSLLEGVITLDKLIEKTAAYRLGAAALTDTNGMYGIVSFYKKAIDAGIKPILGTYINEPYNKNIYAVLLAKNFNGYSDICRIITARQLKNNFSLFNILKEYLPDIFILSGSADLLRGIPAYDNIFAELIITPSKKMKARELYELARSRNFKYIISNPVYFAEPHDFLLHKIVSAIRNRDTLVNLKPEYFVDKEFYFKSPDSFSRLLKTLPEAFANISYIVENCNVDLGLGKFKVPAFPGVQNYSSYSLLMQACRQGLEQRYKKITDGIKNRLETELQVIDDLHLAGYFLIVYDIFLEARRRGMMMVTRGSAANSLVCYALGLTEVDPVKYNFYFERFLNKSRSSLPDIDIDFSWKERDEIVQYVFQKYGYDRVAFISTHVTFRARYAFRETAKASGFSNEEISEMSRFIPWTDARNLPHLSELFPEARSLKFDKEPWKSIVAIASQLANFPRHLSIHASGIIITPGPITTFTGLQFAQNKGIGLIVTQPDMYGVEDLGLVKIDLLSQRSLGVLRDTLKQINNNYSEEKYNSEDYKEENKKFLILQNKTDLSKPFY